MRIPKGSENCPCARTLRFAGTVPETRFDLYSLRIRAGNPLGITKAGPTFGHVKPENGSPTDLIVQ